MPLVTKIVYLIFHFVSKDIFHKNKGFSLGKTAFAIADAGLLQYYGTGLPFGRRKKMYGNQVLPDFSSGKFKIILNDTIVSFGRDFPTVDNFFFKIHFLQLLLAAVTVSANCPRRNKQLPADC